MRGLLPLTLLLGGLAGRLAAQTVALDCGQPAVAATLSASVPRANLPFAGHSGETVYLRFLFKDADPGFQVTPAEVVDAYARVIKARTASTFTVAGNTPIDLSSQGLELDLPSDGIYTLHLNNATTATGTVLVTMARLNRPCGAGKTLACGRAAAGEILALRSPADTGHAGQLDTYQFPVNAGDLISFRLLRVAVAGALDTGTGFFLAVYGPDGHVVNLIPGATDSVTGVVGPGRLPFAQVFSRSDVTATVTGNLTVLVFEPSGTRGGVYDLAAIKLNGGCGTAAALSCSSTLDGQLTTPLATGFYTLQANGGDVYSFRAARSDATGSFAPSVAIYDPQGVLVDSLAQASAVSHAAASKVVTFRSPGTYLVLVTGPLDGSTGAYSINTTLLNRPCQSFQALSASALIDGTVSGLLRNNIYTFSAKAGDSFLLRLLRPNANTLFRPRIDIYDRNGAQIQFLNTDDLDRRNFTIPGDGTYSLVVTDSYDNTQSGSYTFSLLRLNQPENAVSLNCGAPAAGNFPRSLSSSVYTYTVTAGESFTVRMLPASGNPQTSIEVYDAKGNFTGQALSGFGGVDVLKPSAGVYTVLALDASTAPAPATFTLDLMRTTNACSAPAAQGKTTSGVVSAATPLLAYSIPAASGDVLALRSASTTPGFAAQMELYDPDGTRLDAAVFGISRTVSTTGTYTVLVGSAVARTAGGYSFAWQLLNKPVGASPVACGGTTAGALSAANQFRYYTLSLDAGDILRLLFTRTNDNSSPGIEIFDPTGSRIAANSDVTQKVAAGGSYLVLVSPSTSFTETGSYTIAYQRPNNPCSPVTLTCGQTKLRQVTLPGQLDTFTFNGTGGDVTTVRLATRSGSYAPFVEMYNAAGTRLASSSNGVVRSVLAADGVYTLLVRDSGAVNLGSYRAGIQDETNTCPVNDSEAPTITLIRPTGGEVVPGGNTFRIQWQSDDNVAVVSHDIALSTDAGKTFGAPIASVNGNQQAYDWFLPTDIAPSRTAVIRVTATDAAGNAQSAASDLLTLIGSGFKPNASATFSYDANNRLTQAALDDGRTIQYTWDAAGNLTQITITGQ